MSPLRSLSSSARSFAGDRCGATATEYGLIIFLISLAIGFALPSLGDAVSEIFLRTSSEINAKLP